MMKIPFVEPVICLSVFALTLNSPLTTQYVYRRIWEETGNYSIALESNTSECAKNKSSPIFAFQEVRHENSPKVYYKRNVQRGFKGRRIPLSSYLDL